MVDEVERPVKRAPPLLSLFAIPGNFRMYTWEDMNVDSSHIFQDVG